ncbi:hypothetical protein [Rhodococcus sp. 14-2496-1d]|uniref:hypothetical protein n=1 Tax=Rhodococcus sp. 14-2496-1d TaxID=2023146 RepID=UPI00117BC1E8|nr:hypothetical protein [Rhodococcus sp. 14-2496-1d]
MVVIAAVAIFSLVFADDPEDMSIEACQNAVATQLKSPATASFTRVGASEVSDGVYNVSGYVDGQNSFGAVVRMNFVCRGITSPYVTADDVTVDD